ncbi:hypothetical protein [Streptomyces albus]
MTVRDLQVRGTTVAAKLLGYSSPEVPRCCPDRQRRVKWDWRDGKFRLTPAPASGGGLSV